MARLSLFTIYSLRLYFRGLRWRKHKTQDPTTKKTLNLTFGFWIWTSAQKTLQLSQAKLHEFLIASFISWEILSSSERKSASSPLMRKYKLDKGSCRTLLMWPGVKLSIFLKSFSESFPLTDRRMDDVHICSPNASLGLWNPFPPFWTCSETCFESHAHVSCEHSKVHPWLVISCCWPKGRKAETLNELK